MAKGKYKRKRLNKMRRETNLKDTELSTRIVKALADANIYTLYDLDCCHEDELKNISGIGDKYMNIILDFKKSTKNNDRYRIFNYTKKKKEIR